MEVKPGYKQTDAGLIPDDWTAVSFLEAVRIASGQVSPLVEPYRSMPLVGPDHIESGTGRLLRIETAAEQRAISGKYLFRRGDIVYSKIRPHLRKAIRARCDGLCSADMYPLSPAHGVEGGFIHAAILGYRFSSFAESVSARSGMPKVNRYELSQYTFAVPSRDHEQAAIACALSDVDELLDGLDLLIAKKRDLKQAAMQQLLSADARLPGFGGEWKTLEFDDVLVRVNAKANQVPATAYRASGRFPVVDQGAASVVGFSDDAVRLFRCPEGGVIVFGDHTCVVKYVDFDFLVGADGTQIMHATAGHSSRFLAYHLQWKGIAPTGYSRHFSVLKARLFRVPLLPEQTAIAEVLTDMDAELAALEARREKTRALKQAMMQELLTGRIRLA